ncbi:MAG: hypothetical protein WCL27_13080, partial [Betaproteobacteria bacterium]
MSINSSENARLVQPSSSLREHVVRRTGNEGGKAAARPETPGESGFMGALLQSFTQLATNSRPTDQTGSDTTSNAENTDPVLALANFVQNLFAALGNSAGDSGSMPPASKEPGLTKEALASSLKETQSTDSNRYDRNLALLNNFDTADTNGDSTITRDEAHAFNEANNIPTIEGGVNVSPDQNSASQPYQS